MAILSSCCCCRCSIRRGSFASGIYTLIFHALVLSFGGLTIDEALSSQVVLWLTISSLILSLLCVVASIILLVGICVGNPVLTMPWVIIINATSIFESCAAITLATFLNESATYKSILFVLVFLVCSLNFYCTLCIISQYQMSKEEQRRMAEENLMMMNRYKKQNSQIKATNDLKVKQNPISTQVSNKNNFLTPDYCPDNCKNLNRIQPSSVVSDSISISEEKTEIQFNLENDTNNQKTTNGLYGRSLCTNLNDLSTPEKHKHVTFGDDPFEQTSASIVLMVPNLKPTNT